MSKLQDHRTRPTENGIETHVTEKGKIVLVCQKDGDSVTFQLDLEQARNFRDVFQSMIAQVEQDVETEPELDL